MEVSSRRKACDLCFKKKIRCDGLRPTCSNCSLYKVSCRTTLIQKKTSSNNKQPSIASIEASTTETKRDDSLDARLARIEAKLDALQGANSTVSLDQLFEQGTSNNGVLGIPLNFEMTHAPSSADCISPRSPGGPSVPPLTEVLPVVESYFQDYNSFIPLFNQQSFMRLMDDYYKPHGEKPRVYAGVINVVLAMSYRVQSSHYGDAHDGFNDIKIKTCVDNAKTMLDEFMTRTQDTLGLQALLGLVILYQTSPDQTASSVLISAAMRLAHTLRLDSKRAHSELSPQEARQRANIFWVCYMLDKDISLRTITPSSQIDSDIDIDLPSLASEEYGSLLCTLDGHSQFYLFRAKIKLAHLEGRIYDSLLSNRSRKLSHEARSQAVAQIDRLMEQWEQSIPVPFRPENMTGNLLSGPLVHMTNLYQTYMMCLTMMHGPYSHDSPWLKSLGGLGSGLLRTFNPRGDVSMNQSPYSNPAIWGKCVTTSRAMLNILSYQTFSGCSVWLSACVYFSAMTFIFVNLIYHPTNKSAVGDKKLAELSMLQLQKYFNCKGLEKFKQLRHVLLQIEGMAKAAFEGARSSELSVQPRYHLDSTFLPEPSVPVDVFDMGFGQDLASNEFFSTIGSEWIGTSSFNPTNTNPAAAHVWPVSGTDPFLAFEPS